MFEKTFIEMMHFQQLKVQHWWDYNLIIIEHSSSHIHFMYVQVLSWIYQFIYYYYTWLSSNGILNAYGFSNFFLLPKHLLKPHGIKQWNTIYRLLCFYQIFIEERCNISKSRRNVINSAGKKPTSSLPY